MQLRSQSFPTTNYMLKTLVTELESECQNVINLIHQLQSPSLSTEEQAEILAELRFSDHSFTGTLWRRFSGINFSNDGTVTRCMK